MPTFVLESVFLMILYTVVIILEAGAHTKLINKDGFLILFESVSDCQKDS